MEQKQGFFKSIGKDNCYIAANLFYAYFAQGIAVIMLGAVLPALKQEYMLNYQVGGMLLSVQMAAYAVSGLAAGFLPMYFGLKNSFIGMTAGLAIGMTMLLISGNPIWLLIAMVCIGINKGSVTTYNNQIISDLAKGSAGPLNLLHAFFAIGATIAPVAVLLCSKADPSGWRMAVTISAVIGAFGLLLMSRMKLDNSRSVGSSTERKDKAPVSYGFFRERLFWVTLIIAFCYQAIEGAMMSWTTSFFVDSGVMTDDFAQVVTSALWISLLVGRLSCSRLAARFRPYQMITAMAVGQLVFLLLLVNSRSFIMMMIATIGLGLSMSGMYGTTVSNAGDMFARYPVCMGFYVLMTSMGAVIAPTVVGTVANVAGMRLGMSSMLTAAAILLAGALYNVVMMRKRVNA